MESINNDDNAQKISLMAAAHGKPQGYIIVRDEDTLFEKVLAVDTQPNNGENKDADEVDNNCSINQLGNRNKSKNNAVSFILGALMMVGSLLKDLFRVSKNAQDSQKLPTTQMEKPNYIEKLIDKPKSNSELLSNTADKAFSNDKSISSLSFKVPKRFNKKIEISNDAETARKELDGLITEGKDDNSETLISFMSPGAIVHDRENDTVIVKTYSNRIITLHSASRFSDADLDTIVKSIRRADSVDDIESITGGCAIDLSNYREWEQIRNKFAKDNNE